MPGAGHELSDQARPLFAALVAFVAGRNAERPLSPISRAASGSAASSLRASTRPSTSPSRPSGRNPPGGSCRPTRNGRAHEERGAGRRHGAVELAGDDDPGHLGTHRDQVDVGQRERRVELLARDVVEQPDVREPLGLAAPRGPRPSGGRRPRTGRRCRSGRGAGGPPRGTRRSEWARPRLPEYIATNLSSRPSDGAERVPLARHRIDLVAAAPDGDRRRPGPAGRPSRRSGRPCRGRARPRGRPGGRRGR